MVDVEEIFTVIKNCVFFQRDIRRLNEIYRMNFLINNIVKCQKNLLIEYFTQNEELQDMFLRNFMNTEYLESFFDEEIGVLCLNNLKKSKLSNFEDLNICAHDFTKLENVMDVIHQVILTFPMKIFLNKIYFL